MASRYFGGTNRGMRIAPRWGGLSEVIRRQTDLLNYYSSITCIAVTGQFYSHAGLGRKQHLRPNHDESNAYHTPEFARAHPCESVVTRTERRHNAQFISKQGCFRFACG